jgi:hypothetical protein
MKIYFSEASNDALTDELFHSPIDNKYFYYCLEVSEDTIRLMDTCDREVPLSFEDIVHLQNALIVADHATAPLVKAQEALDKINSDAVYLV